MTEEVVHLHLEHPLVARLLSRFRDPGFAAERLSRVTALADPESARVHAVAFRRLSLFGTGAARLHDRLVAVAAALPELPTAGIAAGDVALEPLEGAAEERLIERLWRRLELDGKGEDLPAAVRSRLVAAAAPTFAALWRPLEEEADGLAHRAEEQLAARGRKEAHDLQQILADQRLALERQVNRQLEIEFTAAERDQRRQWEDDRRHMQDRLKANDREQETEPAALEALYRVRLRRISPVGLVFLWPAGR